MPANIHLTEPPVCVENQLSGNTESGVFSPSSSNVCTVTPSVSSIKTAHN